MKQIIYGDVVSKSNNYKIIKVAGKSSLRKSDAVEEYEKKFYLQCSLRNANISGHFELYIDTYFSSNRKDLDNCLKIVLDSLEACRAISNDRNCVKIVAQKFVDKKNPRIEFEIKEV